MKVIQSDFGLHLSDLKCFVHQHDQEESYKGWREAHDVGSEQGCLLQGQELILFSELGNPLGVFVVILFEDTL